MAGVKRKFQLNAGDKVGNFTLERRVEDQIGLCDVRPKWRVKCKCGNIKLMVNRDIKRREFCGWECGLRSSK